MFVPVLLYRRWSQFNTHDVKQQRYHEVIDSLQHLCNNVEPGTDTNVNVIIIIIIFFNNKLTIAIRNQLQNIKDMHKDKVGLGA